MNNILGDDEIPIGFGMALAADSNAMQYFSSLDNTKRKEILDQVRNIHSKNEMQSFVEKMYNNSFK